MRSTRWPERFGESLGPPFSLLRDVLHYDADTGELRWRVRLSNRVVVGGVAGFTDPRGAVWIKLFGKAYLAHRLVWAWVFGAWPRECIDHIDGNPSNNRLGNLRDVSHAINLQNERRARRNNKSGFLGVSRDRNRWAASLMTTGWKRHIGTFDTPQEAHAAYVAAKRIAHAGCTL